MKKRLSVISAFAVMLICCIFTFSAYADETTTVPEEPAQPISISSANTVLGLSATSYNYDGKAKTPNTSVTYTDTDGNKVSLVKNTDYKVTYSNNTNAGTATVKVDGIGNYTGSLSKTFKINAISLSAKSISMSFNYLNAVYSGDAKTPTPTIYWTNGSNKVKLVKNKDYTVSYKNNRNMGQGTIIIKGKGNFSGTVNQYFKILPKQTTGLKTTASTANSVTLKWNKQNYVAGYQIVKYDPNKKVYVQVKRVSANTTSCTVTGLNASTAYHFKVRAFTQLSDKKTNYYGAYSSDVAIATTPIRLTLTSVVKSGNTINVEWKATKSSGYQIFYSTDSKFKKNVKCITVKGGNKTSYKIKNINKKSTYYVKVRAYINYKNVAYKGICSPYLSTYYSNLYATYTSSYVNNANRTRNLEIASKAISGTIVQPGQTFSFNNVVGPRTSSRGYKSAPVFSGSNSTENGIGGGICQVASTMFNCALNANVGIIERHQHSQRVSYVPLGRDAAIYGTVQDFRWKNTTKYPIRVIMTVKNGKITCSFYTCVKAKPAKVSLKVTQSGKNFTLRRSVNGKVNYTCKSKY